MMASTFRIHLDNEDTAKSVSIRSVEDGPLKWVYTALTSTLEIAKSVPHHHHACLELEDRCIALLDLVKGIADGSFGDGTTTHKLSQHLLRYQIEFEDLAKYMAKQKKRGWFSSSILHRSSIEKKVEARSRRLEEIRMGFVWLQGADTHHYYHDTEKPSTVIDSLSSRHLKYDSFDDSFDSSLTDESIHDSDHGHSDIGYLGNTSEEKVVVSPGAPPPRATPDIAIESPRAEENNDVGADIPAREEEDTFAGHPVHHDTLNSNPEAVSLDGWTNVRGQHKDLESPEAEAIARPADEAPPEVSDLLAEAGPQIEEAKPSLSIEGDEPDSVSETSPAQDNVDPSDAFTPPIFESSPVVDDEVSPEDSAADPSIHEPWHEQPLQTAESDTSYPLQESQAPPNLPESHRDLQDTASSAPTAAKPHEHISLPVDYSNSPQDQIQTTEELKPDDVPGAVPALESVDGPIANDTFDGSEIGKNVDLRDRSLAIPPVDDASASIPNKDSEETQIMVPTASPSPETSHDISLVPSGQGGIPIDERLKDDAPDHEIEASPVVESSNLVAPHESAAFSDTLVEVTDGHDDPDASRLTGVTQIERDEAFKSVDDARDIVLCREYSTGHDDIHADVKEPRASAILHSTDKDVQVDPAPALNDTPHVDAVDEGSELVVEEPHQANHSVVAPHTTLEEVVSSEGDLDNYFNPLPGEPVEVETEGNGMDTNEDLDSAHDWEEVGREDDSHPCPFVEEPRELAASLHVDEAEPPSQSPAHDNVKAFSSPTQQENLHDPTFFDGSHAVAHPSLIESSTDEALTSATLSSAPTYPEPVDDTPPASDISSSPAPVPVRTPSFDLTPAPLSSIGISFSSPTTTTSDSMGSFDSSTPMSDTSDTMSIPSTPGTACSSPDVPILDLPSFTFDSDTIPPEPTSSYSNSYPKLDHSHPTVIIPHEPQEPSPHARPYPQPDEPSQIWKATRCLVKAGTTVLPHCLFLLSVYLILDEEFVLVM